MTTKKHTISLTQGAADALRHLIGAPGLLTDPGQLYRVGEFSETHLVDLDVPEKPERAWQKTQMPAIEISERTRDALKALVQAAITKGALSGHASVVVLIREFGLAPDAE